MDQFIEKSKNKFNNTFCYNSLNYITTKKPIQLKCIKHSNIFQITTRCHLDTDYGGCKECDRDYRFNILEQQSKVKFGNNYIIYKESFQNTLIKIKIKCVKHNNDFEILSQKHLTSDNGGCNKCSIKNLDNLKLALIEKSNLKFNNNFNFKDFIYNSATEKNKIVCIKHDKCIIISASDHLKSMYGGCKDCNPKFYNKKEKKEIIKNEIKLNITLEKNEKFKLLKLLDYDNLYKISNYGKVYSLRSNDYMKITENKNGYCIVRLTDSNSKSKIYRVHRLVALLFNKNENNKDFVDHIDNVRNNNYYKNLRWVTHKENMSNLSNIDTFYSIGANNIITTNNENNNELLNNNNYKNIGIINDIDLSNYKINEYGNIINITTNNILKYNINDGYIIVRIRNISFRVHRLVGYVFLTKPKNFTDKFVINHIDENRLNNYYKNLEWCTSHENTTKYFTKKILQLDIKTNKIINEYKTFTEACEKLGKNYNSHISKCCNGIYKTALGYKWKIC